jgi:nucleotide-binding universal stress UspA family protein
MLPIKKILCPIDFSDFSAEALNNAGELARIFGAEIYVLHVMQSVETFYSIHPFVGDITADISVYEKSIRENKERELNRIVAQQHFEGIKVSPLIRDGDPYYEIVAASINETIDLIVIATHGAGGWHHTVFGSVAEKVIRLARCPVLVTHVQQNLKP